MTLVAAVPLQAAKGVFKPCRWCSGARGHIDAAPVIEPARHVGRMICDGCGRQTGWVSDRALRKAEKLTHHAAPASEAAA
ncbi:hypothetical protein [Aureimonas sp. Leaf427]|uniref:hypothetical protein n=1 Tax=Aureimonas sp. Leaf427 TaxID=1736375 RepID=UPI00070A4748|nr:hypothetical protein [Aureimonas sp. Leaf427]KQT52188.1 hypothetical protein ASG62_16145 [Aureimonas sp. Leaf427]